MRDENGRAFNLKEAKKQYVTQRLGGGMVSDEQIISVSASKIVGDAPSAGSLVNGLTITKQNDEQIIFDGGQPESIVLTKVDTSLSNTSENAISNKAVKVALDGKVASSALDPYVTREVADSAYVKVADLTAAINSAITAALANYYTKTEADDRFQPKTTPIV